jgi:hypothetical protein
LLLVWGASQLPALVHALFVARHMGIGAGLRSVLEVLSALMPMVLGVMMAALILSLLAGRPPTRREGELPRADAVDLAAYSIVPFLLVQNVAMFYFIARETPPSPLAFQLVMGVGLAWSLVAWCFALIALRDRRRRDA